MRNAVITGNKCFKMWHLPHHQASHNEGVEDGEEAINRRWIKAGKKERERNCAITLSKSLIVQKSIITSQPHAKKTKKPWGSQTINRHTSVNFPPRHHTPNYNQDHRHKFPRNAKKKRWYSNTYPENIYLLMEAMFPVPKKAVIIKNTWAKCRVKNCTENHVCTFPFKTEDLLWGRGVQIKVWVSDMRIQKSRISWCRPASAVGSWRCRCLQRNQ